ASLASNVLDHIFVDHDVVGHAGERRKTHVDFALAASSDLVVVRLDSDADSLEQDHHISARVLQCVRRRHWEIAFLGTKLVAEARSASRLPVRLDSVDLVIAIVHALVVMYLVEDEMLELRPEISAVAEPRALKISFRLLRDVTRVAAVRPARDGIGNAADQ